MRKPSPLLLLAACDPNPQDSAPDDSAPVVEGCRASPLPVGAPRVVAVSHPYTSTGAASTAWELLTLDGDTLSPTGRTMSLGRGNGGPVVWSPDGSLAVAVHDDGTLGVFGSDGTVVEAAWDGGGIYAGHAAFDAAGERLWVVDGNWAENGGGVYAVAVDCSTGALTLEGLVVPSKLGAWLFGDVLVGDASAATVDLGSGTLGSPVRLFEDPDAIIGGAARRGDTLVVGDFSAFASTPNRVVFASVAEGFARLGEVEVLDPYAVVAVEGGAIVSSGFGDELVAVQPEGVLDRMGAELPGAIGLGPGGLALVAEVSGVRLVRLEGGQLSQAGYFSTPALEDMVGSIGVQP